ncbi:MAG: rRNA maturation RNase YbeY [Gammaproteobacteria bacterium]
MTVELDVDYQIPQQGLPDVKMLQQWAEVALPGQADAQLGIRIVDETESQMLNRDYRGKDRPTNVLSFPMELPEQLELPMLGDLVICAPVVAREADEQNKSLQAHWAHMVIHGVLHLQGYDHIVDDEAEQMEALEIRLLQQLGFSNPYGND